MFWGEEGAAPPAVVHVDTSGVDQRNYNFVSLGLTRTIHTWVAPGLSRNGCVSAEGREHGPACHHHAHKRAWSDERKENKF